MRSALRIAALSMTLAACGAVVSAAEPIPLDSVIELVKAGVGDSIVLRLAGEAGPGFTVGLDEVLTLKRAGASDSLIESLMELAAPGAAARASSYPAAAAGGNAPDSFRISRETDESGNAVIHITNLDASGQRIGGPPPPEEPARRNAYQSRSEEPAVDVYDEGYPGSGSGMVQGSIGAAGIPQVIVNVFQPDQEPVRVYEDEPQGIRYVGGYLPGYGYGYGCGYGASRCYPYGVPSPPGSWSHYKRYHSGEGRHHAELYNGGLAYRHSPYGYSGRALPVPYHTAGAYQLNRMRANVRLGR